MNLIAFSLLIAVLIVLVLPGDFRRHSPLNIILLELFTLCKSIMIGVIASYYKV